MTSRQPGAYVAHSEFSDPGPWAHLLTALPTHPAELAAVVRNVIAHYRASEVELPTGTRDDINLRWLREQLATDQSRHSAALVHRRPPERRLQGCCRDHTLLAVAGLRAHDVPARSRVGFAGYFVPGWCHDHVVVEAWIGGRWRRFDTELDGPRDGVADPTDLPPATPGSAGFCSASAVWLAHRDGRIDACVFGVDPTMPALSGPTFLFNAVIHEVAHRSAMELLLWDSWGRMRPPGEPFGGDDAAWADEIAQLVVASDDGDAGADRELADRFAADVGLHPGGRVLQGSPYGLPAVTVDLRRA